jgi:hypothetical protein
MDRERGGEGLEEGRRREKKIDGMTSGRKYYRSCFQAFGAFQYSNKLVHLEQGERSSVEEPSVAGEGGNLFLEFAEVFFDQWLCCHRLVQAKCKPLNGMFFFGALNSRRKQ